MQGTRPIGSLFQIGPPVGGLIRKTDFRTTTMAIIEILQLTSQIQRWLDAQVARHLAAQAAKLHH